MPLVPPVGPEGQATYLVKVVAPRCHGIYQVKIALVQESVRWFDATGGPVQSITLEVT